MIRQLIATASAQCGFDERTAGQVAMAVDEAICNIHRHGYGGKIGKVTIDVKTSISPSPNIEIRISDEAVQVDTVSIKSRELDEIKPGGLGVHLIRTVMDDAHWSKREHRGMSLIMKKTFIVQIQNQSELHQHE